MEPKDTASLVVRLNMLAVPPNALLVVDKETLGPLLSELSAVVKENSLVEPLLLNVLLAVVKPLHVLLAELKNKLLVEPLHKSSAVVKDRLLADLLSMLSTSLHRSLVSNKLKSPLKDNLSNEKFKFITFNKYKTNN